MTREVISEAGYENLMPSDVALRCGVSEATIYKYFPTKRELLVHAAESWFEDLLTRIPDFSREIGIFERLLQVIKYSLTVIRDEPALTRYVLLEIRSNPTYRTSNFYHLNRRFTAGLRAVISDAISLGVFRRDLSPRLIRNMIFGSIEHQTWAYLRNQGEFSVDETGEAIANMVFRGAAEERYRGTFEWLHILHEIGAEAQNLEVHALSLRTKIENLSKSLTSDPK